MGNLNNPSPQVIPYMSLIPGIQARGANRTIGKYYGAFGFLPVTSNTAVTAGIIYTAPFYVFTRESFDRISTYVGTGAAGNARMGVYKDSNLGPNSLVFDAGAEIDTSTSGSKEITINQSLDPGLYWLAIIFSGIPTMRIWDVMNMFGFGSAGVTGWGGSGAYASPQTYGVLPDPHPVVTIGNQMPVVLLRRV